jgi:hypothetical protein
MELRALPVDEIAAQLDDRFSLLTAEGVAIPPNTTAELKRNMARLTVLHEQIAAIEKTRLEHGGCERLSYRNKSG